MSAATPPGAAIPASARVPRLSYFFPAHNEEANLEALTNRYAIEAIGRPANLFRVTGRREPTP